jgi:hypothetical protein
LAWFGFEALEESEVLVATPLLCVADTTLGLLILAGWRRLSYSLDLFLFVYTKLLELLRRLLFPVNLVNCSAEVARVPVAWATYLMPAVVVCPFCWVSMVWLRVEPYEF